MCKALAVGGQRCAAHTRPAYQTATPGTPEWDEAAAHYASTPTGHDELTQARDTATRARDWAHEAACNTALRRGTALREATHTIKDNLDTFRANTFISDPPHEDDEEPDYDYEPEPIDWYDTYEQAATRTTHEESTQQATTAATDWLNTAGTGWNRRFDDPETANGLCTDVAEDFTHWANNNGYTAENIDLNNGGPHTITVLNGTTVVDFTYRQFDPYCEVPVIEDLAAYVGNDWNVTHRYT